MHKNYNKINFIKCTIYLKKRIKIYSKPHVAENKKLTSNCLRDNVSWKNIRNSWNYIYKAVLCSLSVSEILSSV